MEDGGPVKQFRIEDGEKWRETSKENLSGLSLIQKEKMSMFSVIFCSSNC